jgi:type IV secretory pathway VirB10-like protein
MTPSQKRAYRIDLILAGIMVVGGLAVSGLSLVRLAKPDMQMAQGTPPLQSTPGAESKPSAPSEPVTTGTRPTEVKPQPAQPDAEAQKAGATPVLPPAPAEKTAAPIR